MIATKILLHSRNPDGEELITYQSTYPRIIHAEFMTHRAFSRNAASSRAIPITKMIESVKIDGHDVIEFWGRNQSGMQALEALTGRDLIDCKKAWRAAGDEAMHFARVLSEDGAHKQVANRVLEPYSHITVIHTSTNRGLANFFKLRAHVDAQPEFQVLAFRMLDAYLHSQPDPLDWNGWHIPMAEDVHADNGIHQRKLCVATGRIARISYLTHEGQREQNEDIKLHDRLAQSGHWSPFEHSAQAKKDRLDGKHIGNFGPHWLQYRKMFETENFTDTRRGTFMELLAKKPKWITL